MKKLIIAALCALTLAFVPNVPTTITLAWDPFPCADLFKIYMSPDVSLPPANWLYFTNTAGTNSSISFPMLPQQMYFYATASNFWGESGPSNSAGVPAPPQSTNVVVRKGP